MSTKGDPVTSPSQRRFLSLTLFAVVSAALLYAPASYLSVYHEDLSMLRNMVSLLAVIILLSPCVYLAKVLSLPRFLYTGVLLAASSLLLAAILELTRKSEMLQMWPLLGLNSPLKRSITQLCLWFGYTTLIGTLYLAVIELIKAREKAENANRDLVQKVAEKTAAGEALRNGVEEASLFSRQLAEMHKVNLDLSRTLSVDDLCLRAVELGKERLGFERLGIWLVSDDPEVLEGSYGVDESGNVRDERDSRLSLDATEPGWRQVLGGSRPSVVYSDAALGDHKGNMHGRGWAALAELRDGERILGVVSLDTLLSGEPITENQCSALLLFAGAIARLFCRKRAEEALKKSEAHLRLAIESTGIAVWDADLRNSNALYVDPGICRLRGCVPGQFGEGGDVWTQFCHPDDIEQLNAAKQAHIRGDAPFFEGEFRSRREDGRYVWIQTKGVITERDPDGKPVRMIGTSTEVTARKQSEEERLLLASAIEQSSEIIMITGRDGTIQYVNKAFEAVTGNKRDEVIGRNVRVLESGERDAPVHRSARRALRRGETWEGRFTIGRSEDALFTVEAAISPVRDSKGAVTNYVGVMRDITEELKAGEEKDRLESQLIQAQKMESIGRLAGGVAHDFNNMMGVVIGYSEMAMEVVDPSQGLYEDLQKIREAAGHAADITRRLLGFARKQLIMPRLLELDNTVANMIVMLRSLIGEEIDLVWLPGRDLWPVKVDPSQISQILVNLVVNARDAIGRVGKITIETSNAELHDANFDTTAEQVSGDYVVLTVGDEGCGMDEQTLRYIFEPFFTTKAMGKGTGLGLATVYGIVKQNNGHLEVRSRPGEGTIFSIYLPRYWPGPAETPAEDSVETRLCGTETVLVVEDDEPILSMSKRVLEDLGYTVLAVKEPEAAISLAREYLGDIHLLVTDVVMPHINGRELADRICAIRPEVEPLFMSGYPDDVIADRGVLSEEAGFIQKPFSVGELARKVREALTPSPGRSPVKET
jgi:PAS domain S-box-containing protein